MTPEIMALIIVFLNAMATLTLWRTAARRPEKLKKQFLNRLWRSKPITPNISGCLHLRQVHGVSERTSYNFSATSRTLQKS